MWTCVLIGILCYGLAHGFHLPKYEFEENCGKTLHKNVGMLYFTADDLRTSNLKDNQCSVTIKLISSRRYSQIMFYFPTFDLRGYCEDRNLTITQQTGHTIKTTKRIPGLADSMCGLNRTLVRTGLNFTTFSDQLTITYSYSDKGKQLPGYFSIKFLEFHTGECDDENLRRCMYTKNCVKMIYHCSSEIQACPLEDLTCDDLKTAEVHGNVIGTILIVFTVIFWLAVVLYLLKKFGHGCKVWICRTFNPRYTRPLRPLRYAQGRRDDTERPSGQRETVNHQTGPTQHVQTETRTQAHVPVTDIDSISVTTPLHPTEPSSQGHSSVNSSHSDIPSDTSDVDIPPNAHANNQIVLYNPPPRYGDVVAPSYEDVIADTARYQTSLL